MALCSVCFAMMHFCMRCSDDEFKRLQRPTRLLDAFAWGFCGFSGAKRTREWVKKSKRVCNATDKFASLFTNRSKSVTRGWIEQLHPPSRDSVLQLHSSTLDENSPLFSFFSLHFNYVKIFSKSLSTHSTTETFRRCRTMTLFSLVQISI